MTARDELRAKAMTALGISNDPKEHNPDGSDFHLLNVVEDKVNREELRAKAIEAMADAYCGAIMDDRDVYMAMTAAFDALHEIVYVVPVKPTDEMLMTGGLHSDETLHDQFLAMATTGDLTEPKK